MLRLFSEKEENTLFHSMLFIVDHYTQNHGASLASFIIADPIYLFLVIFYLFINFSFHLCCA